MVNFILILIAIAFAAFRFSMPSHSLSLSGTYEAFAHLFIGGLFGAWLVSKDKFYLLLLLGLTIIEVIAFFTK